MKITTIWPYAGAQHGSSVARDECSDEIDAAFAQEMLLEQRSPEQISGHTAVSPETVYQRVYANKRSRLIAMEGPALPKTTPKALRRDGTAWHDLMYGIYCIN